MSRNNTTKRRKKAKDDASDVFTNLQERIDVAKLKYVMRHYTEYKDVLNLRSDRHVDNMSTSPHVLNMRYLARCDAKTGVLRVRYRQRDGKGRFTAIQSVSLQCMQRQIRHTVAGEFYIDIDIVNCHPVITLHMMEEEGLDCDELEAYVADPDACRKGLMQGGGLSRDQAKRVYLSLINGGCAAHRDAEATLRANGGPETTALLAHLNKFKAEMCAAHEHFAKRDETEFDAFCQRKQAAGKTHNLKASYMNTLLCDYENKMLRAMWIALGKPMDCVLCFDGILVPKRLWRGTEMIKKMQIAIRRATHIRAKLKVKPMQEALTLPAGWEDEKEPELFYKDYVGLIKGKDEQKMSDIENWACANLTKLSNQGEAIMAVRDLITKPIEGYNETSVVFKMREPCKVYSSLDVDCVLRAENAEPDDEPLFTDLGKAVHSLVRGMKIKTLVKANYLPYLDTPPIVPGVLNTWGGFPLQRLSLAPDGVPDFTKTLFFAHLRDHFFAEEDEFEHWQDHVADMVQMPGRMPTNCAHLYASDQGVGKELLAQFMSRLLGTANACKVDNMSNYFEDAFTVQYTSKLIKIFEELPDQGLAFKYHNKLKNDVDQKEEFVHEKGRTGYWQPHFGRNWFNTNNKSRPLYIEPGDRRYTVHLLKGDKANCAKHFAPLWAEIKRPEFMVSAFQYFTTRTYEEANVMRAFETQAKRDMIKRSIPHPIRFLMEKLEEGAFNRFMVCKTSRKFSVSSKDMQSQYSAYCDVDVRYHRSALKNAFSTKLHLECENNRRKDPETGKRVRFYDFTADFVQDAIRGFLKSPKYVLDIQVEVAEV